ncbi:hypothetical protein CRYUN_Cryun02cG0196800 [Craigia yunnanensis]
MQGKSILGAESHPLHLHGFNFFVVGQGFGNFDPNKDPKNFNLIDPVERNTVGVPSGGWIAIRFLADNPVTANSKLFREYIGAEDKGVTFSDVPTNSEVDFHFILYFAIDYTTSSSPTDDPDTFAECIGRLLLVLKQNRVVSFASIAPYNDDFVQPHYLALWRKYGHLIDYVNFQFYAYDKGTTIPQFLKHFHEQGSNYRGDDSKKAGFRYEKRSQTLLARST